MCFRQLADRAVLVRCSATAQRSVPRRWACVKQALEGIMAHYAFSRKRLLLLLDADVPDWMPASNRAHLHSAFSPRPWLLRPQHPAIDGVVVGQLRLSAAVGIHHVDLVVAIAVAGEGQLAAVHAPACGLVIARAVGQPRHCAAIGVHEVDLGVAIAVGCERDALAVGRDAWVAIVGTLIGQRADVGERGAGPAGAVVTILHVAFHERILAAIALLLPVQRAPIRAPGRHLRQAAVHVQPLWVAVAIGGYQVQLRRAIAIRYKYQLGAVRRDAWVVVVGLLSALARYSRRWRR